VPFSQSDALGDAFEIAASCPQPQRSIRGLARRFAGDVLNVRRKLRCRLRMHASAARDRFMPAQ
jgi:hypothetical protein